MEIIDLATDRTCPKPADHPREIRFTLGQGTFYNGRPLVCGGDIMSGTTFEKECRSYDFGTDSWVLEPFELVQGTVMASTALLANGTWMILGGLHSERAVSLLSGTTVTSGPTPPEARKT